MCSNDGEKSCQSMKISEQKQQQRRQDQEGEVENEVAHHSKCSHVNSLPVFQRVEKITPVEEENNAGETIEETAVVNRSNNNYCVRIESDDSESTQSSDVDEDFREDDLQDRRLVSEIPRVPQTFELGTQNGQAFPTVDLPSFGDVYCKNSSNVTLTNKTIITGHVHISKVVCNGSENKKEGEIGCHLDHDEKRDSVPSQISQHGSDAPLNANTFQDINKVKQWLITWRWAAIFCTTALILVAIIVIIVLNLSGNNYNHNQNPIFPEIPDDSSNNGVKTVPKWQRKNYTRKSNVASRKLTRLKTSNTETSTVINLDIIPEIMKSKDKNRDKENELVIYGVPLRPNENLTELVDSALATINASFFKTAVTQKFRLPHSNGIVFRLTNKTIRDEILKLREKRKSKIEASELNETFSNSKTIIDIKSFSYNSKLNTLLKRALKWKSDTKNIVKSVERKAGAVYVNRWNGPPVRLENLKDLQDLIKSEEKKDQDFHNYFINNFKIYHANS